MRALLPASLVGALALVGCGSADFVRDRDGTLHLTLDEYRIRPENVKVRAGRLHIVARNAGRLTHNVVIEELERQEGEEPKRFGRTPTAHPGETVSEEGTIVLPPGKYRIACSIANHDDLGQFGELQVEG
jgi:uncharacterized cupredoxin-like copper-binding protein